MTLPRQKVTRVLVVEDDPVSSQIILKAMSQAGFEASHASTVREAVAAIDGFAPDLMLLDVGLPDGDGFEVCRHVQRQARLSATPVIFISGHDDTASKLRGFEAGGVDYVTKPIVHAELLARVTTHLRLKRAFDLLADLQAERIKRLGAVQVALMPQPAALPEARFAVRLEQLCEAGGDIYDVVNVGDGVVDYLVADVSGHDISSSLWTSSLKTLTAEYATPANPPLDIVRAMNRVLTRILPDGHFFTLAYLRLNRRQRRVGLVLAGHPPPLLVRTSEAATLLDGEGDVVGAFEDAAFHYREFRVSRGDRLFLYSDGLIELQPDRGAALDRLREAGDRQRGLDLDAAVDQLREAMVGGHTPQDDILLLGIEV